MAEVPLDRNSLGWSFASTVFSVSLAIVKELLEVLRATFNDGNLGCSVIFHHAHCPLGPEAANTQAFVTAKTTEQSGMA